MNTHIDELDRKVRQRDEKVRELEEGLEGAEMDLVKY